MIKKSLFLACSLLATSAWAIDSSSWTCSSPGTDSCGNLTADGVVVDAPVANSTGYAWVSTNGAPAFDPTVLPGGVPQDLVINGATFTSEPFAVASPNAPISFHFNYVTSDGEDFGDYAWARLLDSANNQVALLFTARTHPTESVVPGLGMPPHQATLTPATVSISRTKPEWSPLKGSSGSCYSTSTPEESGCGYSGWVKASYTIANPGAYKLEIGTVNWRDQGYDSGLAVDGLIIDGGVPSTLALNNPGTLPAQSAPVYTGTVADPGTHSTVDLVITSPNGHTESLQAPIQPDNSYSSQGTALPPGVYTIVATITGTTISQTQVFEVLAPAATTDILLDNPGNLPANSSPLYKGKVINPGTSSTVDLLITGPNNYQETLLVALKADLTYSQNGAALPPGEYTVTATITGTNITKSEIFVVSAVPTPPNGATPVPTLGVLSLFSLSSLLAGLAFVRGRNKKH